MRDYMIAGFENFDYEADCIEKFRDRYAEENEEAYEKSTPTGIKALDAAMCGGFPDGLIIMAAGSNRGKSTLITQIAGNIAAMGRDVLIFSLEMEPQHLFLKETSRRSFVDSNGEMGINPDNYRLKELREGMAKNFPEMNDYARDCVNRTCDLVGKRIRIVNNSHPLLGYEGWKVSTMAAYIQACYINKGKKAPVVFIDYLQRITSERNAPDNPIEALKIITTSLKRLASDFHTPFFVLSSIGRAAYKDKVNIGAAKGSGDIEFDADNILGLNFAGMSEDFDEEEAKRQNPMKMEINIIKRRIGRRDRSVSDTIPLDFFPDYSYFCSPDEVPEGFNLHAPYVEEIKPKTTIITTGAGRTSCQPNRKPKSDKKGTKEKKGKNNCKQREFAPDQTPEAILASMIEKDAEIKELERMCGF